ncbi:MAG: alpha/beta hydrolase [Ktedonobacterales bacterium]
MMVAPEIRRTPGPRRRQRRARGSRGQPVRCLLVHGLNGEPDDLAEVERTLRLAGFATQAMWLPGHGVTVREFRRTGWCDWYAAVRQATQATLASGERVLLVGHSMGGAVCLGVAAELRADAGLVGVVALCPPARMMPWMHHALWLLRHVMPFVPAFCEDISERGKTRRGQRRVYRWTATDPMYSLLEALPDVRAALPQVRCPALIVTAKHDHVVPVRDGLEAYGLLGTPAKDLLVLEQSYHAVGHDVERGQVCAHVLGFCRRASACGPHARPTEMPFAQKSLDRRVRA